MKRFAISLALVAMAVAAFAQAPAKRSIASVEEGDNKIEIFAYDHEDGSRGYYLGLPSDTFILLGSNVNDAVTSMKQIQALFDAPVGDYRKYVARGGSSKQLSEDTGNATVAVEKKAQTKKTQLKISSKCDGKAKSATLQKATVKNLLKFLTGYQKRHPDR